MVKYDEKKAQEVKRYIAKAKDAATDQTVTVPLRGRNVTMKVYRFPLDMLVYNKENGRLVAQVEQWEKENDNELDAMTDEGRKVLKNLLLNLDPERTKFLIEDMAAYGQRDPGIARADGILINGNRRMAILSSLHEQGKGEKFGYVNVAVLDDYVDDKDLFMLEAKLQFSTDLRLEYLPVNVLLTIERGLKFNTKETMANEVLMLPGGLKELESDMEVLELMKQYLSSSGHAGEFWRLQKVYSHFVELVGMIKRIKKKKSEEDVEKYIELAFRMIKCGVGHRDLRPLNEIAKATSTVPQEELFDALSAKIDLKKDDTEITVHERNMLLEAVERADVSARSFKLNDQARVLLDRVRNSLRDLSPDNCNIPSSRVVKELEDIKRLVDLKQKDFRETKVE
jgi:hypothetical protein